MKMVVRTEYFVPVWLNRPVSENCWRTTEDRHEETNRERESILSNYPVFCTNHGKRNERKTKRRPYQAEEIHRFRLQNRSTSPRFKVVVKHYTGLPEYEVGLSVFLKISPCIWKTT